MAISKNEITNTAAPVLNSLQDPTILGDNLSILAVDASEIDPASWKKGPGPLPALKPILPA